MAQTTRSALGVCLGALGLHLSSRMEASWRAAQGLLQNLPPLRREPAGPLKRRPSRTHGPYPLPTSPCPSPFLPPPSLPPPSLYRPPPPIPTPNAQAGPESSSCAWLHEFDLLDLPHLDLPLSPELPSDFRLLPALPRLLPSWQQLHSLAQGSGETPKHGTPAVHESRSGGSPRAVGAQATSQQRLYASFVTPHCVSPPFGTPQFSPIRIHRHASHFQLR